MRKPSCRWHWPVTGRRLESTSESARVVPVVVDQIRYRLAAVLLRQIKLHPGVLLDVVVLHVGLGSKKQEKVRLILRNY